MPSLAARGALAAIQIYKWTLSPLVGRDCRYLPTCSSYAMDAIAAHGAWAGGWMATARLCRCAPWGGSGWDPAPVENPRAPWFAPWRFGDWKRGYRCVVETSPSPPLGEGGDARGAATVEGCANIPPAPPLTPHPTG